MPANPMAANLPNHGDTGGRRTSVKALIMLRTNWTLEFAVTGDDVARFYFVAVSTNLAMLFPLHTGNPW